MDEFIEQITAIYNDMLINNEVEWEDRTAILEGKNVNLQLLIVKIQPHTDRFARKIRQQQGQYFLSSGTNAECWLENICKVDTKITTYAVCYGREIECELKQVILKKSQYAIDGPLLKSYKLEIEGCYLNILLRAYIWPQCIVKRVFLPEMNKSYEISGDTTDLQLKINTSHHYKDGPMNIVLTCDTLPQPSMKVIAYEIYT